MERKHDNNELLNVTLPIIKSALSQDKLDAFNALGQEEQLDYLDGFQSNIDEWKKKNSPKQQNGNLQLQSSGMSGQSSDDDDEEGEGQSSNQQSSDDKLPQDGLRHWQRPDNKDKDSDVDYDQQQANALQAAQVPSKNGLGQGQSNNQQQNALQKQQTMQSSAESSKEAQEAALNANDIDSIKDALDKCQQAAKDAKNAADQASKDAQDAQANADKAKQDAQAALQAAAEAEAKAAESGDPNDAKEALQAAKDAAKAQKNADKAQQAADIAKQKADKAEKNAQNAKDYADKGERDLQKAQNGKEDSLQKAKESAQISADQSALAAKNTQQSEQASNAAELMAGNSLSNQGSQSGQDGEDSDETMNNSKNQDGDQSGQGNNGKQFEHGDPPTLSRPLTGLGNPNGKTTEADTNYQGGGADKFGGDDFYAPDGMSNHDLMKQIAEEAGQELDNDDYVDPVSRALELALAVKEAMRDHQGNPSRGFGNSIMNVLDYIDKLFLPTVRWRELLKKLFNMRSYVGKEEAMAHRRMGLDDTHPLYKGRYLHPNERKAEADNGINQVFILIDNSGSMQFNTGNGHSVFENITSEIVDLEVKTDIKHSALAYFGCGPIAKSQVHKWTLKDCKNKKALIAKIKRNPNGENSGGTSIKAALASLPKLGKDIYNQLGSAASRTLLICISDGGDYFEDMKDVLNSSMVNNTIWLLLCNEKYFEGIKKSLVAQGFKDKYILNVDPEKEW